MSSPRVPNHRAPVVAYLILALLALIVIVAEGVAHVGPR